MPAPNRSPPTATVAWNRLWWSGPLSVNAYTGGVKPVVCRDLLEASLVVLVARALGGLVDTFAELLKHEATDRLDTAVEVHRAEHGLDRISQDRRLLSTAGGILAFAKAQIESDPSSRPTSASVVDDTTAARALAGCPSGRSGKAENRWSVTTTPSTASPRNSSRSFDSSPGCSAHHDRCVRA